MSVTILGFGTGLGILFLSGRSRIVRRLHGVSSPSPSRQTIAGNVTTPGDLRYVVVETLGTISPGKGKVFRSETCELIPGRGTYDHLLCKNDRITLASLHGLR